MNFGEAISQMKCGLKVAREGWNGKGMYIRIVDPHADHTLKAHDNHVDADGTPVSFIAMKTADNKFVPWLASQTDMLAEDWVVAQGAMR